MRKAKRNAGMMSPPGKIALHRAIRAHRRTSHEHYDLAQQIPFPTRLADFRNGSIAIELPIRNMSVRLSIADMRADIAGGRFGPGAEVCTAKWRLSGSARPND